jgi:hypothetical protein
MKLIIISVSVFLLVSGCASSTKIYTSDGAQGYSINCSGNSLNWGMCYEKAGELCGEKGYEVLEKVGDDGGAMITGNQFGLYGGSITTRSLIIRCKK